MDFKSMTVKDFFEVNGGRELCEQYAPNLLKYPLKLFYKKTCGEIFDLVTSKGLVPADKAAAIEAAIKAKLNMKKLRPSVGVFCSFHYIP